MPDRQRLVTDAEVLQEILHRYVAIDRRDAIQPAFDALLGALPAHLPRIEIVVDIDDKTCPCGQGELQRIGEAKSERLDIVAGAVAGAGHPAAQICLPD